MTTDNRNNTTFQSLTSFLHAPAQPLFLLAAIRLIVHTATKEAQNLLDDIDFFGHPAFEGNDINNVLKGKKVAYDKWENIDLADQALVEVLQATGLPVVRKKKKK